MDQDVRRVRRVEAEAVIPVRVAVLRPHMDASHSRYPEDGDPEARHFAIEEESGIVAVGSSFRDANGWRLRGMATVADRRGAGLGAAILTAILEDIRARGGGIVWCNARTTVEAFYAKQGFVVKGGVFELPGIGPHVRMETKV
ncbi:MAG: GNAT family N-acetyltransferase [Acidobacteria bacterium]|nr:GNAT family N-acetyltransferase [Acidobacteriota bacterium]